MANPNIRISHVTYRKIKSKGLYRKVENKHDLRKILRIKTIEDQPAFKL